MLVPLTLLVLAASATPPATVPFVYDDTRVWVSVTVPGHGGALSFVLDDGVTNTFIDEEVAKKFGWHIRGEQEVRGVGGGTTHVGQVDGTELIIGPVRFRPRTLRTAPLEKLLAPTCGRHVDGIIGAPFFHQHVVELDFDHATITVRDPGSFAHSGGGTVIPVQLSGGVPVTTAALDLPDGRTLSATVLLDLGAKSTLLLSEPFVARTGLGAALRSVEWPLGAGFGGPTRYAFARLRALSVGPKTRVTAPIVGLSVHGVLTSGWYDGLVGAGYLSRFRVIFDEPHERVILEPTARTQSPDRFDASGLFLEARGADLQTFAVTEVRPDSPARAAGFGVGDEIEAIEDEPGPLTLGQLRRRLSDPTRPEVRLRVRRQGHSREVQLTLREAV